MVDGAVDDDSFLWGHVDIDACLEYASSCTEADWHAGVRCILNSGASESLQPGCIVSRAGEVQSPEAQPGNDRVLPKFVKEHSIKQAIACRAGIPGNLTSDIDDADRNVALHLNVERGARDCKRAVLGLIDGPEAKTRECAEAQYQVGSEGSQFDQACFSRTNHRSQLHCRHEWYALTWQKLRAKDRTLRAVVVLVEHAGLPENPSSAVILDTFTHFFWPTHDGELPGRWLSTTPSLSHQPFPHL